MSAYLTFEQLCERDCRLRSLYAEALTTEDNHVWGSYCRREAFLPFRRLIVPLVGPSAECEELRSAEAEAVAVRVIREALPACRGCACKREEVRCGQLG